MISNDRVRLSYGVDDEPGSVEAAGQLSAQTYALYLTYRHPGTPWYAKVFAALIVCYVFSPIDPIPDFIPGIGLLDEIVVVPIGVLIAAKMIPRGVFEECREKACKVANKGEKPVGQVARASGEHWQRSLSSLG